MSVIIKMMDGTSLEIYSLRVMTIRQHIFEITNQQIILFSTDNPEQALRNNMPLLKDKSICFALPKDLSKNSDILDVYKSLRFDNNPGAKINIIQNLVYEGAELNLEYCSCEDMEKLPESLIKILLESGKSVDVPDFFGRTALFYAVLRGNLKSVRELLRLGANPNINIPFNLHSEYNILKIAKQRKFDSIVALLLQFNAK